MAVCVTFNLAVDPNKMDDFLAAVKGAAPETRAYDGCQLFDIWIDQNTPGNVLFYEIWDSRAQQEKYLQWRTETGVMEALGSMLTAPPTIRYHDKFDG